MQKRGEPLPINQALNRSRTKLGLELSAWMVIVFVSITVFLVGFRFYSHRQLPAYGRWCLARHSQAPEDLPALGPQPFTEELL